MRTTILLASLLVMIVAGCSSGSRLNPRNWFGGSEAVTNPDLRRADIAAQDPRPLVNQVTAFAVEQVPGGAILRATGLPVRQGYFDGELIPVADERPIDGILSYQFRINPPVTTTAQGPQPSREVIVARFVSDQTLEGVSQIQVVAAQNALGTRR
ncbi:hypothetical protein [Anianabacter salinae]|uniref:hypothetical protein n=1 Tax=Anianabacter salinae TaxID=2851023 RepID=UPI00225E279C|nr:hypothetical protein [Anianabacter salinae]MBV0911738.1 hypothetical protein [Anianabacter salinae]